jgi:hypothetical protein
MPNRKEYHRNPDADRRESHKGIARQIKVAKRIEAELRNEETVPDKRRSFWRERGFSRQSQAASLIKGVVVLTNAQAKEHKQRSEDWPLLPPELGVV